MRPAGNHNATSQLPPAPRY